MSAVQSNAGRDRPLMARILTKVVGAFGRPPVAVVDPVEARLDELRAEREKLLARHDYNPQDRRLHPEYEQLIRDGNAFWPQASMDYGPFIQIKASCFSCAYYRREEVRRSVTGQADTHTSSTTCTHPSSGGRALQGCENTPTWCPYFGDYLKLHVQRLSSAAD